MEIKRHHSQGLYSYTMKKVVDLNEFASQLEKFGYVTCPEHDEIHIIINDYYESHLAEFEHFVEDWDDNHVRE